MNPIKKRVYEYLFIFSDDDWKCKIFQSALMGLIVLNVVAVMLETVASLSKNNEQLFYAFEVFSVAVFTIEYLLRLWSCTSAPANNHPVYGRIRFAFSILGLVDLLAILPFYLPMLFAFDLRFIRMLRLIRIFRLFKMGRYSKSLKTLNAVVRAKKEDILITLFIGSILLIVASTLVYYFETEAQPEAFPNIPAALWWGVITLTTVGYGDVFPVTIAGKIVGSVIAILGIGMFALPAGILGSGFVEELEKNKQRVRICPHCGEKLP